MIKNSDIDKSPDASYSNPFSYDSEIVEKIPLIRSKNFLIQSNQKKIK